MNAFLARLQALASSPWRQRFAVFLLLVIVAVLARQLMALHWPAVLSSLPSNPLFYLFFALKFLIQPVSEVIIYTRAWPVRPRDIFGPLLRKQTMNLSFMEYSGEAYYALWAKERNFPLLASKKAVGPLSVVRDVNILSALAGHAATLALISWLLVVPGAGSVDAQCRKCGRLPFGCVCICCCIHADHSGQSQKVFRAVAIIYCLDILRTRGTCYHFSNIAGPAMACWLGGGERSDLDYISGDLHGGHTCAIGP